MKGIRLGLDCGGTSTRAILIDGNEQILFEGKSGPANWASTPRPILLNHWREATQGCPEPDAVCACLAGLLTDQDRLEAESTLQTMFPNARVRAMADYTAAMAACGGVDACVIAGTGSVVVFRTEDGAYEREGGGGPLLGDLGSCFDIGRRAIRHMFLSGRPEPSPIPELIEGFEEEFGVTDGGGALRAIYRLDSPAASIGHLAVPIARAIERGDAAAYRIANESLSELAKIVDRACAFHRPGLRNIALGVSGGMFRISESYVKIFRESLDRHSLGRDYSLVPPQVPIAVGAARLA